MIETEIPDPKGRDRIIAELTMPGAAYALRHESVNGRPQPVYESAPATLPDLFAAAMAFAGRDFIVDGERRMTYAETFAAASALSGWLASEAGVGPGDHVAIAMANRAEWAVAFIAIVSLGATAVLANSRAGGPDMAAAIAGCGAKLVLADGKRVALLRDAGIAIPVIDEAGIAAALGHAPPAGKADIHPDAIAAILFTSGTTGRAKGAMLSHRALITGIVNGQMSGAIAMRRLVERHGPAVLQGMGDTQQSGILVFPLFHISGLGAGLLAPMLSGGKAVIMRRWDPDEALRIIGAERITALSGVPTMLWDILHRGQRQGADLSSLGSVATGGQALPINLFNEIRGAFPRVMVGGGWGMTETCGAVSLALGGDYLCKPESAGFLLPTWQAKVCDEQGRDLPPGACGELLVSGAAMMTGYFGSDAETGETLSDGWLRTGDLGFIDSDGYVHIADRKKDMVISGGENIYCAEVERVISALPQVIEVASFGLPDERLGERLAAAVVLADGADADPMPIRAHVGAILGAYKIPADIFFDRNPLPRNATGKIDKKRIRERHLHAMRPTGEYSQ